MVLVVDPVVMVFSLKELALVMVLLLLQLVAME
jgi:hypothetical protein